MVENKIKVWYNKFIMIIVPNFSNSNLPLAEYPRPQFKRDSYISLNGEWDYLVTNKLDLSLKYEGKILVPYCIESQNSNVNRALKEGEWI